MPWSWTISISSRSRRFPGLDLVQLREHGRVMGRSKIGQGMAEPCDRVPVHALVHVHALVQEGTPAPDVVAQPGHPLVMLVPSRVRHLSILVA